jgi:hypothetical protein
MEDANAHPPEAQSSPTRGAQEKKALRAMFLARLQHITQQRESLGVELTGEARHLVDRALYSTYWDCVRLGAREEAREALGLAEVQA